MKQIDKDRKELQRLVESYGKKDVLLFINKINEGLSEVDNAIINLSYKYINYMPFANLTIQTLTHRIEKRAIPVMEEFVKYCLGVGQKCFEKNIDISNNMTALYNETDVDKGVAINKYAWKIHDIAREEYRVSFSSTDVPDGHLDKIESVLSKLWDEAVPLGYKFAKNKPAQPNTTSDSSTAKPAVNPKTDFLKKFSIYRKQDMDSKTYHCYKQGVVANMYDNKIVIVPADKKIGDVRVECINLNSNGSWTYIKYGNNPADKTYKLTKSSLPYFKVNYENDAKMLAKWCELFIGNNGKYVEDGIDITNPKTWMK